LHRTKSGEREGEVPSSRKGEGLLEKLEGLAGGGVKGEEREVSWAFRFVSFRFVPPFPSFSVFLPSLGEKREELRV